MTANATLYLLKGQVLTTTALSAISGAPAAATERTSGGGITQFQLDFGGTRLTLNRMEQARIAGHLQGFAGYILHLTDGQPDAAANALIQRIISTKQVVGNVIEPDWDDAGRVKRTLLGIAARYGGLLFADSAVFNAQGKFLIGMAHSQRDIFLLE